MSARVVITPPRAARRSAAAVLSIGIGLAAGFAAAPVMGHPSGGYTVSTSPSVPAAPGRAGRLADFSGSVWVYEHDRGEWIEALRNRPLTSGDRVSTGNDARAELRIGSTTLRIAGRSEVEVHTLDDHRLSLHLHSGSVALRVRTRDWAEQVELTTPEVRLKPLQAGHFRIDRLDDVSFAGAWRGELLVDEASSFPIAAGQRMEFWHERGVRHHRWSSLPADALQGWAVGEDQREERTAFSRHVSPEMTGAEDLDRHGRWERVPDHGVIWFPLQVSIGWAPYLFGNWVWVRHWGWVWVDNQPWGFAPFHYGRWVQWRGQWGWVPGSYVPRPVFTPAPRPPHEGRPHPPPHRPVHPVQPVHPPRPPEMRPPPRGEPAPRTPPPWSAPPRDRDEPRHERGERGPRGDRGERSDRDDREGREGRGDRGERGDRRHDQPSRSERERGAPTPQPVTLPPRLAAPVAVPTPAPVVVPAQPATQLPATPPIPATSPPAVRPPPRAADPRVAEPRPGEPPRRDAVKPESREEPRKRVPESRSDRNERADRAAFK